MDDAQIRREVLEALQGIAPEVEAESLRGDRPLRDEVDLDSMDWLRFLAALHQRLGVNIPEADYQQLTSLDALLAYVGRRLAAG
ncbi:acyl carrier protein [Azotobacter chroococcum]|jgi:acyl carrier protein|uniref:Acyl carrier protein n=2 Tax=Azotobacter chroococcum TaxID=353 RepID=A0A0C4WJD6_9GAMM|nr:acyl carrier protein [Azotobacter chroococcum]AJE20039.1 acyl carrier protein [Azotobacter chroococcum NCIMB 8003]QQE89311.1 acyl carrier protein [Azotobacter chroococcum]TBW04106.1 acyl carrier protein [Azotobacter chroococcum]TBW34802.1 acyl carrier protein [Azotobacter chroococcum]TKD34473.1 acyl carrier protein [Azotobacter chroococcum]